MAKEPKTAKETEVDTTDETKDGIVIKDPMLLRPVELPLVITLPATASKAQIEYAKVLNGYAYQNPKKWNRKKDALIANLRNLKDAPDPVESPTKLSFNSQNKLPA